MTSPKPAALLVPAEDAAPFLGTKARILTEWARRGLVPHHRLGRKYLFNLTALQAWAEGHNGNDARSWRGVPLSAQVGAGEGPLGSGGNHAQRQAGEPVGEDPRRSQARARRTP